MSGTSIKEVARRAGVSVGTVSNVLNRPERVAEPTRRKVLAAIRELGFVRNESARQLRAGRSRTIGLVVLDVANPFFTDVARGVEALADEVGSVVTLANSAESADRERRHLDLLLEQRVQGVLITPVDAQVANFEAFTELGIPVVLVDRGAGTHTMCSVAVDDVLGGRLALTHLIEQGHRRIAFVGGPETIAQVADRRDGARQALTDAGSGDELIVVPTRSLQVAEGQRAAHAILDMTERPTAMFCANDLLALGVLRELTRQGLRVPEDLAIVGYDDIDFAGAAAVPLSSVSQPREELGRSAAQLLLEEGEQGVRHRHRHVVFSPELVVRESSSLRRAAPVRPIAEGA